jgi:phospholipid transport system substrate-binding protein
MLGDIMSKRAPSAFLLTVTAAGFAMALTAPAFVQAAPADPAIPTIESFDAALIQSMKKGSAGVQARFKTLEPAVNTAFDLTAMTRFAVGPDWAMIAPADQAALSTAFGRFTAANYAHNFDSYSGQTIKVLPDVETRGVDKLVKTEMTSTSGSVTAFTYRMRQSGSAWKVIDVYYNGSISQLTTQRSDFSATLAKGGAAALVQKLNAQADKLLK